MAFYVYRDCETQQLYFGAIHTNGDIEIYNWDATTTIIPYFYACRVTAIMNVEYGQNSIRTLCRSTNVLGKSLPKYLGEAILAKKTRTAIENVLGISTAVVNKIWIYFDLVDEWRQLSQIKRNQYSNQYMAINKLQTILREQKLDA